MSMSTVEVKAGQLEDTMIVTVNGKVKYSGPAFEFNGLRWTELAPVSTPDPLPALLAAARKVQNLLDEVARHRIDGMDVLASALWDDVMAVASDLRTALTAYEQQRQ